MRTTKRVIPPPAEQVRSVTRLLVRGSSEDEIRRLIGVKFQATEATATALLTAARERLRAVGRTDPDIVRGLLVAASLDVLSEARDRGDGAVALRAIRTVATLAGVAAPEPDSRKDAALDAEIQALEKALGVS